MQTFHSVFTLRSPELLNVLLSQILLPKLSSDIGISGACLSCLLSPSFFEVSTFSFASTTRNYNIVISVDHSSFSYHALQLPESHFLNVEGKYPSHRNIPFTEIIHWLVEVGGTEADASREASSGQPPRYAAFPLPASTSACVNYDLHYHQGVTQTPLFSPLYMIFYSH